MSVCKRVFSVGFGPGLDSMYPARSWRCASHVAGSHDWLPQKTGAQASERQDKVDTICTVPLDCGTPTTRMLYPFGAVATVILVYKSNTVTFQTKVMSYILHKILHNYLYRKNMSIIKTLNLLLTLALLAYTRPSSLAVV